MPLVVIAVVLLVGLGGEWWLSRRESRGPIGSALLVLLALMAAFAPVAGLALAFKPGQRHEQERIWARFVGYSVPLDGLAPSANPARLTIGKPDASRALQLPLRGYGDRAIQLELVGADTLVATVSGAAGSDVVAEGDPLTHVVVIEPLGGMPEGEIVVDAGGDPVALEDGDCLFAGSVAGETLRTTTKALEDAWIAGRSTDPSRRGHQRWKGRVLRIFGAARVPQGDEAAWCIGLSDPASATAGEACDEFGDVDRDRAFAWRTDDGWRMHVEPGTTSGFGGCAAGPAALPGGVSIPLRALPTTSGTIGEAMPAELLDARTIRSLPGLRVRMLRRVHADGDRRYEAPFRLGPPHDFRFALLPDRRLVVLAPEEAVSLRPADLFAPGVPAPQDEEGPLTLEEGVFSIAIGSPGTSPLVLDLAASADGLVPKPALEGIDLRVNLTRPSDAAAGLGRVRFHVDGTRVDRPTVEDGEVLLAHPPSRGADILVQLGHRDVPGALPACMAVASILLLLGRFLAGAVCALPAWMLSCTTLAFMSVRMLFAFRDLADNPASSDSVVQVVLSIVLALVLPPLIATAAAVPWRMAPDRGLWFVRPAAWTALASFAACVIARQLLEGITSDTAAVLFDEALLPVGVAGVSVLMALGVGWGLRALVHGRGWPTTALAVGVTLVVLFAARFGLLLLDWAEEIGRIRIDVFTMPMAAAILAIASQAPAPRRGASWLVATLPATALVVACWLALFVLPGLVLSDKGLIWVGALPLVLVLVAAVRRPATGPADGPGGALWVPLVVAMSVLFACFLAPRWAPAATRAALQTVIGTDRVVFDAAADEADRGAGSFQNVLGVSQARDFYRFLEPTASAEVLSIPDRQAWGVAQEHARLRHASTEGALREAFRSPVRADARWPWLGAGFLRAEALRGGSGDQEMEMAWWDYVLSLQGRAMFGSLGLVAIAALYLAFLLAPAAAHPDDRHLALWAAAFLAGNGLFMLGGVTDAWPLSGKWSLLLMLHTTSDVALGVALLLLTAVGLGVRRTERGP